MVDADLPWFHHPAGFDDRTHVELDHEELRHAQGSLRLRPHDPVVLADGRGTLASGRVVVVERRRLTVEIVERVHRPPPAPLWLAPALIRGPRFDMLIEKATELGVAGIHPLLTRHVEVRPREGGEKPERWRRLAITAMKQCRRAWLPEIAEPRPFDSWLEEHAAARLLVADPVTESGAPPQDVEINQLAVVDSGDVGVPLYLLVGPEGGWHAEERAAWVRCGARSIHLGPTRLRAETAALALVSFALTRCGTFRSW